MHHSVSVSYTHLAAVHSIQIGITLGWFHKISVAVGSCRRKRIRLHLRIMIAIPVEAFGRLFPRRETVSYTHLQMSLLRVLIVPLALPDSAFTPNIQNGLARNLLQHRVKAEAGRARGTIRTLSNDI